jgi:predicted dehydrogenase
MRRFELEGGIVAQINSSWAVRVRRDDLVTFQVDGTHGSAVAGLHKCWTQHRVNTPKPVWNPDQPQTMNFFDDWEEVPDNWPADNGFKVQWEMFLRHVAEDAPWDFGSGGRRARRAAGRAGPAKLGRTALAGRARAGVLRWRRCL